MGERKGQNKYYPPDYDPSKGGLNKFLGTHALRERAKKLHLGILIIRFEMPYNIWCDGCENHIGTGVRYNAEKSKIGMYYSTPVYQFRMKCHLCPNYIEIKTDPSNLDYEIVSGARRQERRWDPGENEQIAPEDKIITRKLAEDAMFKLEHGVNDQKVADQAKDRLEQLQDLQSSRWKDDYSANAAVRQIMRRRRREAVCQKEKDDKLNINVNLLPSTLEDEMAVKLMQFKAGNSMDERLQKSAFKTQSIFPKNSVFNSSGVARQSLNAIALTNRKILKKKSFVKNGIGVKLKSTSDASVSPITRSDDSNALKSLMSYDSSSSNSD